MYHSYFHFNISFVAFVLWLNECVASVQELQYKNGSMDKQRHYGRINKAIN
jgi:hypothetical protein